MTRSRILARLAGFALSMALSCAAFAQAIVVGAKEFTEQLLVAEMTTQLLQANGFAAHKGTGFATTGIRSLQESGIIDLYWEYTGTSLSEFNQVKEKLSPEEGFAWVKALDAKRGLVWLAPSKVKPILESLSAQLENETMAALNAAVDLEGRKIEDVARTFLRSRRLLGQR